MLQTLSRACRPHTLLQLLNQSLQQNSTVSNPSPSNVSSTHAERLSHWRSFSHGHQEHHVAESNGLLLALILFTLSRIWLTSFWNTFPCLPETHVLLFSSCFFSYLLSVSFAGSAFLPNLEIAVCPNITLLSYPLFTAEETMWTVGLTSHCLWAKSSPPAKNEFYRWTFPINLDIGNTNSEPQLSKILLKKRIPFFSAVNLYIKNYI